MQHLVPTRGWNEYSSAIFWGVRLVLCRIFSSHFCENRQEMFTNICTFAKVPFGFHLYFWWIACQLLPFSIYFPCKQDFCNRCYKYILQRNYTRIYSTYIAWKWDYTKSTNTLTKCLIFVLKTFIIVYFRIFWNA